ncbi:hypothetical protein DSCW_10140 [Desulfosarcina widdelii]|uniref:Uncharacterized protein n=1 Tax=Desulfosarcina widdelii TaxID=947919 RepID=A0A5K7ZB42_9BACT|nr:hypothetical protein [Desulfosarcina widdelii]BBO73597.1 hypothetical protein DSCW_10140 [Desulfosarcina widdelii]
MPENKKNSSAKKQDLGTESSVETDGPSDEMSAEEEDAFNKIMGEIEGNGDSAQSPEENESGKDDGTVSEEDFAAELEKVVQQADADSDGSEDSDTDSEAGDELDEDQQKAFESIMSQIEGGGDSEEGPSTDEAEADKAEEDDGTVSEEDFSAELEKVVQQADADSDGSEDSDTDSEAGDELDEDQQKAFESIMSQIEGGGDSEDGPSTDEAEADKAEEDDGTVSEEDFSDELEKVVRQADAANEGEPSENTAETAGSEEKEENKEGADADSDESLDKDQQEAFESIMAQIEGGKPEAEEPEGELEVAVETRPEKKPAAIQAPDTGLPKDEAHETKEDITADVDEILKEVAVEEEDDDEKTSPPAPTVAETDPEPTSIEQDRKTAKEGDKKEHLPAESPSEAKKAAAVQDAPSASTQPAEDLVEPQPDIKFKPLPRADSVEDAPKKKAAALREAGKPAAKKWKKIVLGAATVVLILVFLAGYRYWLRKPIEDVEPKVVSSETVVPETSIQPEPTPPSLPQAPVQPDQHVSDQSSLKTAAESLDRLRSQLLAKKAEIEELRAYYQAGIDAEIDGIIDLLKTTNKDSAAMADPRIGLGLSAIQRRDTYIRKLVRPVDELTWNSEELLYSSRKAELLALMATKTSDIDIDGFIRQSHELIDEHTRALEELNIDDVSVSPLSTEAIWNDITSRLPKNPPKAAAAGPNADNNLISEQICNGDYSQKHKLTMLSPKTAGCLAQWKGKDLFLNELKELEPEAARQLATWKGDWLGLNGIEELSPESAAHLARWKGKGLSLNGLSRLSPRVVAILSEWQGDQIELVNVKHMAHWENSKTRLFLSEEMNRKRRFAKD